MPGALLVPFYGVPVTLRSLVRALFAFKASRGALLALDIFSGRAPPADVHRASLPAVSRLPSELWLLLAQTLVDLSLADAETIEIDVNPPR
ncbi:hypothetical protein JCM8547_009082 [Rhodosporidiobolus lusitaniae]